MEDIPGLDYRAAPLAKGMQFQHIRNWSLRATTPITPRIIGTPELDYRTVLLDLPIYHYQPAPFVKMPQTIIFTNPGDQPWNVTVDLAPLASASSGLTVYFTVSSGPGVIIGTILSFAGGGPVVVTAHQHGNSHWYPAPDVSQAMNALPIDQTITFNNPGDQMWSTVLDLVASATSGLAVTFTVDAGPASITGTQVTFSGTGPVTITAHQYGDSNYNIAPYVSQTFNVIAVIATFNFPNDLVVDSSGNIYVADTNNHAIRKITPAGVVTTFAGSPGNSGSTNGTGSAARFYLPNGICIDGADNLYIADTYNSTIRKITAGAVVTTVAGVAGVIGHADGSGPTAKFNLPRGIASDPAGTLYVADTNNSTIRQIIGTTVTTIAGLALSGGWVDGTGSAARFNSPFGICTDGVGGLYVSDTVNNTIRHVTSSAVVTTYAGLHNTPGSADGTGSSARFEWTLHLSIDGSGNVYVCDSGATIRKIAPGGVVTTFAGTYNSQGVADGIGAAARFNFGPTPGGGEGGCYNDSSGNIYVADTNNHTIRKITPTADVMTIAGIAGTAGHADYP